MDHVSSARLTKGEKSALCVLDIPSHLSPTPSWPTSTIMIELWARERGLSGMHAVLPKLWLGFWW